MNHIGSIIKCYRGRLNMTRAELAENICSEKYVYYIEKGDRTPSSELLAQFADRLGVDLFDHFSYLDCINPIEVRRIMKTITRCRQRGEFSEINRTVEEAAHMPDFKREPWKYEIEINRLTHMIFVQQRYEEAVPLVQRLIDSIDASHRSKAYMANMYMMKSTLCQILGDLSGAEGAIAEASRIVRNKETIQNCANVIISVKNGTMTLSYLAGRYEDTIRDALDMIEFQEKALEYERIHYGYFFLSFALWQTGACGDAVAWFKKGLYWVLIHHRPTDVGYLEIQKGFFELLVYCAKDNPALVQDFKKAYGCK